MRDIEISVPAEPAGEGMAIQRIDAELDASLAKADAPFVGAPLPFETVRERIERETRSFGHSGIMTRGNRQVRVTCLRPDDPFGRDIGLPGFILRSEVWDERTIGTRWRPFTGWTDEDRASHWCEVAHTYADSRGRCLSKLCAQYGHGGGLRLPEVGKP